MKTSPETISLYGEKSVLIDDIKEYHLVQKPLKITTRTEHGEFSVYLHEDLAKANHATLRKAIPEREREVSKS